MNENVKIRYRINLATRHTTPPRTTTEIRRLTADDRTDLARLILDAYTGTIDYEGETIAEAMDEVDDWLAGTDLLDHSYCAVIDSKLVSAILLMTFEHAPFSAIVVTDPGYKGTGLARSVTHHSLSSLAQEGHDSVVLYITKGNIPSERLFISLGATPERET
ncbi:MAG: GNAT family N-acetyltransferase [Acidimicrobiia bacterium]